MKKYESLLIIPLKKFTCSPRGYFANGGFGKYVESLAPYFKEVTLAVPVKKCRNIEDKLYQIKAPNVRYFELPYYENDLRFVLNAPVTFWRIGQVVRRAELVNVRIPDFNGVFGFVWAKLFGRPYFVSLTADWSEQYKSPAATRTRGVVRLGLKLYIAIYTVCEKLIVRYSPLVIVLGDRLFHKYERRARYIVRMISTTLSKGDLSTNPTVSRCENRTVRVLTVGRLAREKGHKYLFEALQLLGIEYHSRVFELTVVGGGPLADELSELADELGVRSQVTFRGHLEHGAELFREYDEADLFVLPSVMEGTPKVVLEAMARCVPVIATDVGGTSTAVGHMNRGILVQPEDANALVGAIRRVVEDRELRSALVQNAWAYVQDKTIENDARIVVENVERCLDRC